MHKSSQTWQRSNNLHARVRQHSYRLSQVVTEEPVIKATATADNIVLYSFGSPLSNLSKHCVAKCDLAHAVQHGLKYQGEYIDYKYLF